MLTNKHLKDFAIRATDGELGTIDDIYFDDETWAIRHFIVDAGGWLGGRRVLISPISVVHTDWEAKRLDVALTKRQVEHSPDIDTHKPVLEWLRDESVPVLPCERDHADGNWENLLNIMTSLPAPRPSLCSLVWPASPSGRRC